jgi:hypothetical protein
MKITKKWLDNIGACEYGIAWFLSQKETDSVKVVEKLITEKHLDWANWLVTRLMNHKQQIQYAVYAAEQVIDIFENKYPDDKRPREAIEAAKRYLKNPTEGNKNAARVVAAAANAAAIDYAAASAAAAYAAANAAYASAAAAYAATNASAYASAYAATNASAYAARIAANAAAYAAAAKMKIKIIKYGLELLEAKEEV